MTLKANTYRILEKAIEDGIKEGIRRAYLDQDNPDDGIVYRHLHREIVNSVCEWFKIDEEV